MRSKHPKWPRSHVLSSRRQIVHGFGALIGGAVTGCGEGTPPHGGASAGTAGAPVGGTGMAVGGTGTGPGGTGGTAGAGPTRKQASDRVTLGMTGIVISRLAMGSGTHGSGGSSDQTRLGRPFRTS